MRRALIAFTQAVEAGRDAVGPDFQFHLEIARATQNPHFSSLLQSLGTATIPRARLHPSGASADERLAYLRRVNAEHGSIVDAIENQRRRGGAGGDAHAPREQPRTAPARGATGEQLTDPVVRQLAPASAAAHEENPHESTSPRRSARPRARRRPRRRVGAGLARQDDPDHRPVHAGRLVGHHRPRDLAAALRTRSSRP